MQARVSVSCARVVHYEAAVTQLQAHKKKNTKKKIWRNCLAKIHVLNNCALQIERYQFHLSHILPLSFLTPASPSNPLIAVEPAMRWSRSIMTLDLVSSQRDVLIFFFSPSSVFSQGLRLLPARNEESIRTCTLTFILWQTRDGRSAGWSQSSCFGKLG